MSPHAPKHDDNLESGLLSSTDEKATEKNSRPAYVSPEADPSKETMSSPRRLLVTLAVCFLVTFSLASVAGHRIHPCLEEQSAQRDIPVEDTNVQDGGESETGFAGLLRSASPDVLHRLLHAYFPDRYQHGVYPSDQDALSAVHEKDAPLATTLVQLAKRQNGNSTEPPPDTSEPPPDTSDPTPDPTDDPDPTPTDEPTGNTDPPTSNTPDPTPDPTPTDDPDDTPGTSPPSDEPSPSTSPSPTSSDPDEEPSTSTSTSTSTRTTSSTSPEAPDETTTTRKTTRTPSKSASAATMTTTLPDGGVTVITTTSYYDVYPTEDPDPDSKASPSLQNAGPRQTGEALLPVLLGFALGGFMAA